MASLASTRATNLENGVNLSHWFWQPFIGSQDFTIKNYITPTDIATIKNLGMDHVRLPVDVANLMNWNNPGQLNSTILTQLGQAITMIENAGLSVIVTPFGDFEQKVVQPEYLGAAKTFWSSFAGYLKQFDVNKTFLEVANEPLAGPATWNPIQESLIQSIRSAAPDNTIITATYLKFGDGANDWGAVKGLTTAPLSSDSNVIYNLHFYEPFFFTHQGATWSDAVAQMMKGLPYNATPQSVETLAKQLDIVTAGTNNWWAGQWVRDYGAQTFSADNLEQLVAPAAQWAAQNNVPLLFNEFGVFKDGGVAAGDRLAYIYDLRVIMQEQNINWTAWDWAAGFGMVTKNGQYVPSVDMGMVQALGLDTSLSNTLSTLKGTVSNDVLTGTTGANTIYAGSGNDIVRGGAGNDTMFGNSGADRYLFKAGDGKDTVSEFGGDANQGLSDTIVLENITSMSQVTFSRVADHLIIKYGASDEITVFNQFDIENPARRVEVLELGNGEKWSLNTTGNTFATKLSDGVAPAPAPAPVPAPAVAPLPVTPTASGNGAGQTTNLTINGTSGRDTLIGGDGNDTINGLSGVDSINGGSGNDALNGGDGADTLNGGAGNDVLLGGAGRDSLLGGAGLDTLTGGEGNDALVGGAGADRFVYSNPTNGGKDTIEDFVRGQDVIDVSGLGYNASSIQMLIADIGTDLRIGTSDWSVIVKNVDVLTGSDFLF